MQKARLCYDVMMNVRTYIFCNAIPEWYNMLSWDGKRSDVFVSANIVFPDKESRRHETSDVFWNTVI